MSNGKAVTKKSLVDEVIKLKRENVKSYGQQRQRVSSGAYIGTSGQKGGSDSNDISTAYLKTAGDTMIGPLAFYPKTSTLSSGIMDASKSTGAYSSRIYVIGQGSSADDLEVILGASHAGQILFFQPIIANITLQSYLKTTTAWSSGTSYNVGDVVLYLSQRYTCYVAHTSSGSITPTDATKWHRNNIRLTGADDRVVTTDEIVMLQYDTTDGVWTLVSGGSVSTGANATLSNLTSPTAINQDLNMGTTNSITFDTDKNTYIASTGLDDEVGIYTSNSIRIKVQNTKTIINNELSLLDGLTVGTTAPITFANNQEIQGTGGGIDYAVPSGNTHEFAVNSALKLTIAETLTTSSNDISMGGNDLEFSVGGTINFYSSASIASGGSASALPSNPTGYFAVKHQGNTRYIPFYS